MTRRLRPERDIALTVETLRPEHLADLRRLTKDPRAPLQPNRRMMYRRLGLIVPLEPPRPPRTMRGHPPQRAYRLTELGCKVTA